MDFDPTNYIVLFDSWSKICVFFTKKIMILSNSLSKNMCFFYTLNPWYTITTFFYQKAHYYSKHRGKWEVTITIIHVRESTSGSPMNWYSRHLFLIPVITFEPINPSNVTDEFSSSRGYSIFLKVYLPLRYALFRNWIQRD